MYLENKEYEVRGKTTCDCGYEFTIKDMEQLKRINQPGFYGNAVKHYSPAKCKICGKEVVLLLKQVGQTYNVIDTASEKVQTTKADKGNTKAAENETKIDVEAKIKASNEIICPVCGKACKSQLGLNSHLKTHNN